MPHGLTQQRNFHLTRAPNPKFLLALPFVAKILANCQGLYNPISLPFKERTMTRRSSKFPWAIAIMSSWSTLWPTPKKVVGRIRDTYRIKFLIKHVLPVVWWLMGNAWAAPSLSISRDFDHSPGVLLVRSCLATRVFLIRWKAEPYACLQLPLLTSAQGVLIGNSPATNWVSPVLVGEGWQSRRECWERWGELTAWQMWGVRSLQT